MTTKRIKRPRDPIQLAKLIGDIATGQTKDEVEDTRNAAAVESGRMGGAKVGKARAAKMTPRQCKMVDQPLNDELGKLVETDKLFAAIRQIQAAIFHFKNDDYECAISLAAAAEGLLPTTKVPHVFTLLKANPAFENLDANHFINWLKHPVPPYEVMIPEFEVVMVIVRAVSKLIAVNKESNPELLEVAPPDLKEFVRWAFEVGHLPPPAEFSN